MAAKAATKVKAPFSRELEGVLAKLEDEARQYARQLGFVAGKKRAVLLREIEAEILYWDNSAGASMARFNDRRRSARPKTGAECRVLALEGVLVALEPCRLNTGWPLNQWANDVDGYVDWMRRFAPIAPQRPSDLTRPLAN